MQLSICAVVFQCNSNLPAPSLANLRPAEGLVFKSFRKVCPRFQFINSRNRRHRPALPALPSWVQGHP